MAILEILEYPDKRLRQASAPVEKIDSDLVRFARDMAETMYAAPGVGLAAIQVGRPIRLVVCDTAEKDQPAELRTLINPEVIEEEGETESEEGCLSLPGLSEDVKRSRRVVVEYNDLEGRIQTVEAEGLLAICLQHEIDHLDGILFTDHISPLKRRLALRKVERFKVEREKEHDEAARPAKPPVPASGSDDKRP